MTGVERGPPSRWWSPWNAWRLVSFSWVSPFVAQANAEGLETTDGYSILAPRDEAQPLAAAFEKAYADVEARHGPIPASSLLNRTTRALIWLHRGSLILNSLWVLLEIGVRLASPLALRAFLAWLQNYRVGLDPPVWLGWMLALAVGAGGFGMAIAHHQMFWFGMRMGLNMRQQCIAAVHAKALRLNAAAVAHISQGHVVNLVSNDVRRLDDALPFWVFLWAAPLELGMVLRMVSLELGLLPALAGVSATLLLIPLQAALVRPVADIRRSTAQLTDERVRLMGEVISGVLAMKMLSWELPFCRKVLSIRQHEEHNVRQMARIKAINQALMFAITPLVSFATFAIYRTFHGPLSVAMVFYVLALLHLPKLFMVQFFVYGLQNITELRIALVRLDTFLATKEPPLPCHLLPTPPTDGSLAPRSAAGQVASGTPASEQHELALGVVALRGADYDWSRPLGHAVALPPQHDKDSKKDRKSSGGGVAADKPALPLKPMASLKSQQNEVANGNGHASQEKQATAVAASKGPPRSTSAGRNGGLGSVGGVGDAGSVGDVGVGKAPALPSLPAAASEAPGSATLSLDSLRVSLAPGELLGVCGEVGAGKSSLLAALLGELQPLSKQDAPPGGTGGDRGQPLPMAATLRAGGSEAGGGAATRGASGVDLLSRTGPLVVGSVAYCAQMPWIVAGSVRENILFGRPFDPLRYKAVLTACALCDDIKLLPAGDQTELGESGINLSGGQKARVALARAAYAGANVCLLDDPLCAVDPRVARTLFGECIGPHGLMKGATRVLVTHQRQFLPRCDRVLVLRQGRVVALGRWPDVAALQLPELTLGHAAAASADPNEGFDEHEATVDELLAPQAGEAGSARQSQASLPARAAVAGAGHLGADAGVPAWPADADPLGRASTASVGSATLPLPTVVMVLGGAEGNLDTIVTSSKSKCTSTQKAATGRGAVAAVVAAEEGGGAARAGRGDGEASEGEELPPSAFAAPAAGSGKVASVSLGAAAQLAKTDDGGLPDEDRAPAAPLTQAPALSPWRQGSTMLTRAFSLVMGSKPVHTASSRHAGEPEAAEHTGQLVKDEDRAIGGVSLTIYLRYMKCVGVFVCWLIFVGLLAGQAAYLASDWWLALWASAPADHQQDITWIWVYGLLTGLVLVLGLARSVLFFEVAVTAGTRIHNAMALCVLRAPISFFHTNPAGRILNRFSKDLGQVDDLLPVTMFDALQVGFMVLSAMVLASIAVPFVLPVFVLLAIAFAWLRSRYLGASREVKRWEATSRSPVFASFTATLKGLPTIRAYAAQGRFQETFLTLLSLNGAWFYAFIGTGRWVGFRLDVISAFTLLSAALLAMASRSMVQPELLGLALTHVLQLTGCMQWFVRQSAEVENIMTSTERMLDFTDLPQEPPLVQDGGPAPPPGWPKSGALEYREVTATYRTGLKPVLVDITFSLPGGSSCGVVGRTGSGKSSLMLTLFRLIPITGGVILLDGIDTAGLGLDALRKQLAIIPQDPVLFSGTIRSNLDPWDTHQDDELWRVLSAAKLQSVITAAGGLGAHMAEAGDNLSVGQRQLFCLARALLQRAKVLALDEATANVDRGTDALIQDALRDFAHGGDSNRVLMVIAHRIDTIMDTNRLLVLQAGQLVEQGPPSELSMRPGGLFAGMVAAAKGAQQQAVAAMEAA